MFICQECLGHKALACESYGPCEVCHKTKMCYDIHHSKIPAEVFADRDKVKKEIER